MGWNIAGNGFYKGRGGGYAGGFIPFAKTKAERLATGDPRLSIEERYHDHAGYVAQVKKAVARLSAQRFLLLEGAHHLIDQAQASYEENPIIPCEDSEIWMCDLRHHRRDALNRRRRFGATSTNTVANKR